jgi:hypothetical protein
MEDTIVGQTIGKATRIEVEKPKPKRMKSD